MNYCAPPPGQGDHKPLPGGPKGAGHHFRAPVDGAPENTPRNPGQRGGGMSRLEKQMEFRLVLYLFMAILFIFHFL